MKRKLLLLALLLTVFLPGSVNAAGIGLTPALQEVTLVADQPSVSFKVGLTNSTDSVVTLGVSALDFGALNETGGIAFIGRTGQENNSRGLKSWMTFDVSEFRLNPGESKDVTVTITNQESLSPGGHYGAVIVSSSSDDKDNDSLSIVPAASTLVLLKKTGGENLQLELGRIQSSSSLVRLPSEASLRFHNTGNTHVVPRGIVDLTGPFGSKIAHAVINETSAFVLPDSHRVINTEFKSSQRPWLPGRYTLTATWRYDGTDQTTTTASHHWYIGTLGLWTLGILLVILVLVLRARARGRVSRG